MDAASHNGVDDIRELIESVALAPAGGGSKVYILDEAHMVTQQGFNALLKLVEEPPDHVKFSFATTEPEKVLAKAVAMEGQSISDYNEWAKVCAAHSDAQSKQLFESLIADEERHQDQYEKQMDNIRRFGPSYLALQAMSAPADAPPRGGAAE